MAQQMAKTKILWSITQHSLTQTPAEVLAQRLAGFGISALMCTCGPSLLDHIQALRGALDKVMEETKANLQKVGHFPFLLGLQGRQALLRVPGGSLSLDAGAEVRLSCLVSPEDCLKGGQQSSTSPHIEMLLSAPDMCHAIEKGSLLNISYGQSVAHVVAVEKPQAGEHCAFLIRIESAITVLSGMDVSSPHLNKDLFPLTAGDAQLLSCQFKDLADYIVIPGVPTPEELTQLKSAFADSHTPTTVRHPSVPISPAVLDLNTYLPPRFIVKVDSSLAWQRLPESLPQVDGVLLSRSELGLTIHPHSLPTVQKELLALCNHSAKLVLVASELMYSMRTNPTPTRAEVSDMANAIADGADGLLISEEVTEGPYGDLAAEISIDTLLNSESFSDAKEWHRVRVDIGNDDDAIAFGALSIAEKTSAKAIVCITEGGYTAFRLASFRAPVQIIAFTYNKRIMRQVNLLRAVSAATMKGRPPFDQVLTQTKNLLVNEYGFQKGDRIVFVSLTASSISERNSNLFTVQQIL